MVLRKAPCVGVTPSFLAPPFAQQNHGGKDLKSSLTLSLDLEHAYGVLRVERPDFAGGQRVSPLDAGRDCERWWLRLHEFDEWLRTSDGHRISEQHRFLLLPPKMHSFPLRLRLADHQCRTLAENNRRGRVRFIERFGNRSCDSYSDLHVKRNREWKVNVQLHHRKTPAIIASLWLSGSKSRSGRKTTDIINLFESALIHNSWPTSLKSLLTALLVLHFHVPGSAN